MAEIIKPSFTQRIRARLWKSSRNKPTNLLTPKPAEVMSQYYKRVRKPFKYYIWILATDQGIIHIKMPREFKPPKTGRIIND